MTETPPTFLCGTPTAGNARPRKVTLTRYVCPWCAGTGRWQSGEPCQHCAGEGVTDDSSPGVDMSTPGYDFQEPPENPAQPLPRPPAVMRSPCVDCAFRPGSPEDGIEKPSSVPFYCHHGMHRVGEGYTVAATCDGQPLGYMVCAGWWQVHVEGQEPPEGVFRDPGGADRPEAVSAELDDAAAAGSRFSRLPLAHVLEGYADGDGRGWAAEFDHLRGDEVHRRRLDQLAVAIQANGMHTPVMLGPDLRVWDGHHRLCVADELGLPDVPVEYVPARPAEAADA